MFVFRQTRAGRNGRFGGIVTSTSPDVKFGMLPPLLYAQLSASSAAALRDTVMLLTSAPVSARLKLSTIDGAGDVPTHALRSRNSVVCEPVVSRQASAGTLRPASGSPAAPNEVDRAATADASA